MANKLSRTWAEFRTVYSINTYDYAQGEGNIVFNSGAGGIHPSTPCSVLFRTTQFARAIFQGQPWFYISDDGSTFALYASAVYGGLIPDKEWSYFKGKSVTNSGDSFTINDDAQYGYSGQAVPGYAPIASIEGFTNF